MGWSRPRWDPFFANHQEASGRHLLSAAHIKSLNHMFAHPAEAWAIREKREKLKGEALQQKLTLRRQAEGRMQALQGSLRSRPANQKK